MEDYVLFLNDVEKQCGKFSQNIVMVGKQVGNSV